MNEADASLGDVHFRHDKDGQMSVKAMMIKPNRELAKMYKAVETLEHEALQTRAAMSREVLDLVSELNTAAELMQASLVTQANSRYDALVTDAKVTEQTLRHEAKVMQQQLEAQLKAEQHAARVAAEEAAEEISARDAKIDALQKTAEKTAQSHAAEVVRLRGQCVSTLKQTKHRLKSEQQQLKSEMDRQLSELNEIKCQSEQTLEERHQELMGQYRQLEREKNTQVLQLNQRLEESHQAREKLAEAMAMQVQQKDAQAEALADRMVQMHRTQAAALGIAIDARLGPPSPWRPAPAQSAQDLRGPTAGTRLSRSATVRGKLYHDIHEQKQQIRSQQTSPAHRKPPGLMPQAGGSPPLSRPGSPGSVMSPSIGKFDGRLRS